MSKKKLGFPEAMKITGVLAAYVTSLKSGKVHGTEDLFPLHDQAKVGHLKEPALRAGLVQPTIHRLREKLKPYGIEVETVAKTGYQMKPESRTKLAEVVAKLFAEEAKAAEKVLAAETTAAKKAAPAAKKAAPAAKAKKRTKVVEPA